MITRPLELASRLRPEPRVFDAIFFVNGGLIVLFFFLWGSRFVLAPGLGVDFELPQMKGARAGAATTTHNITVTRSGLIIIEDGTADLPHLRDWLQKQAKKTVRPSLLMRVDKGVSADDLSKIWSAAHEAGFTVLWAADEPAATPGAAGL
jgi:biopolymer transport protein ExbD